MTVDVTAITSADWSRKVGGLGEIVEQLDDIDQAMRILLATPKGAVEHRPEFGCDAWRYLDHPTTVALPHIVRECTDALAKWEPRATVTNITARYDSEHVYLTIRWTATLGSAGQTTEVRYVLTRPQ
jgi:uncharacterized protein